MTEGEPSDHVGVPFHPRSLVRVDEIKALIEVAIENPRFTVFAHIIPLQD